MGNALSQLELVRSERKNWSWTVALGLLLSLKAGISVGLCAPRDLIEEEGKLFAAQWEMVLASAPQPGNSWNWEEIKMARGYELLRGFVTRSQGGNRQAYLLRSDGSVRWSSHEKPAWELPALASLKSRWLSLVDLPDDRANSGSPSGTLTGPAWMDSDSNSWRTVLRYQRLNTTDNQTDYAVILEQRSLTAGLVGAQDGALLEWNTVDSVRVGLGLCLLGLLMGLGVSASVEDSGESTRKSKMRKTMGEDFDPEWLPRLIPVSALAETSSAQGVGATLAGPPVFSHETRRLREQLSTWEEEDQEVEAFEARVFSGKSPREVAVDFVQVAQKLTRGPALFFSHQPQIGALVLEASAGLSDQSTPGSIRFPLSVTLLDQVQTRISGNSSEHAAFELTPDAGLADSMLHHFGVGHFEAWAIPYYSALGRHAQRASLVGVVVLLDSGVESLTQKKRFSRMIRTAGLVVENSLLSI